MKSFLLGVGLYVSDRGGAIKPATILPNNLLFELITEGAVYGPDEEEILYGVGTVFVHHPAQQTIYKTEGDSRYSCMTALFDLSRVPKGVEWLRSFRWSDTQNMARFVEEMLYAYHHTDLNHDVIGNLIWSQFRFRLEEHKRTSSPQGISKRVASILNYIEQNFNDPIGIDDMAEAFEMSSSNIHALFREFKGLTPHQYLIDYRMRTAKHRLVTTTDPIKSVAQDVGYTNTENFCRAFKKHFGVTAASYRKKYSDYGY